MSNHPIIRVLGIDFGTKRMGIAVGQTVTQTAEPLCNIAMRHGIPDWQALDKLVKKWRPDAFIIGIPLNMDGSEQTLSHTVRAFAELLKARYDVPIFETDERLTTKDAKERLFQAGGFTALQDGQVDQLAAQLILENWFHTQGQSQ